MKSLYILLAVLVIILIKLLYIKHIQTSETFSAGLPYISLPKDMAEYGGENPSSLTKGDQANEKLCDCCACGMMSCDKCRIQQECCGGSMTYDVMTWGDVSPPKPPFNIC